MNLITPLQSLLWQPWRKLRRRSQIKQAAIQAYRQWAQCYPEWVVGLFDEHFVMQHVVPLLQEVVPNQMASAPARVVEQWADQFHLAPAQRQLRTHALLPAVVDFLNRFEGALGYQPVNLHNGRGATFSQSWPVVQLQPPPCPSETGRGII